MSKNNWKTKPGMRTLYSVWNNFTDEVIIVDGTAAEAAAAMGIELSSFYGMIGRTRSGRVKKWHIERRRVKGKPGKYISRARTGCSHKLYTVWLAETGELVIQDGTSEECAQAMGLKDAGNFIRTAAKSYKGEQKKWRIEGHWVK